MQVESMPATKGRGRNKQRWSTCSDCGVGRWIRSDSTAKLCKSCGCKRANAAVIRVKTGANIPCNYCKEDFWQYKHLSGKSKFCSKKCADKAKTKYEKTERICQVCSTNFVWNEKPFSNSAGKFCSHKCRISSITTGVNVVFKSTKAASDARYAVSAAIKRGLIVRPSICESCGLSKKHIHAAHFNYTEKLRVRWLCVSCHSKWDHEQPKGGCHRVDLRGACEN